MNQTQPPRQSKRTVRNPQPLGINPESTFNETVDVIDHPKPATLKEYFEAYDSGESNVSLGNIDYKTKAAFDVLQKTQSVLIEVEPWYVNDKMGSKEYDRWEPFVVAFPEQTVNGNHMLFTNLAPLSEVAYQLKQRDIALEKIESEKDTTDSTDATKRAQQHEQRAFTRYTLDCCYNGEESENEDSGLRGELINHKIISNIHACLSPWPQHLIVGVSDGKLYCGRGSLFDEHVDIAIGIDRRKNEYNERKVALYNNRQSKDEIQRLDFDTTHAKYLGKKKRWEVDLDSVDYVIKTLLGEENIDYVSLSRTVEKAFITHIDSSFSNDIAGYPGFEE